MHARALLAAALCALAAGPVAGQSPQAARRSGFDDMTPALQAMQRDDAQNPAMLWVADGETQWRSKAGQTDQACAQCHGDAKVSMRAVAARYPAFDQRMGRAITLAQRISQCRVRHQQTPALSADDEAALGLLAYVALQSRGLPMAPPQDARLQPAREQGQRLWQQRLGQLDLSCAHCHDQRAGLRLSSSTIPQGHANGYPLYRLEWQALGGLQRRIRNCVTGVRAEPFTAESDELTALELYLAQRAAGLAMEAPAVRP